MTRARPHWRASHPIRYVLSHARIAIRQILRIGARGVNRWDIGAGLLQGLSAREAAKIKGAQTFAPSPVDSGEGASATFDERLIALMVSRPAPRLVVELSDKLAAKDFVNARLEATGLGNLARVPATLAVLSRSSIRGRVGSRQPPHCPAVLKVSHDSGGVWFIRHHDDWRAVRASRAPERHLRRRYGFEKGEWNYAFIRPQVFLEELVEGTRGIDYKVHCAGGRPRLIEMIWDRDNGAKQALIGMDGQLVELRLSMEKTAAEPPPGSLRWPVLDRLARVASALSEGMPYVRVDCMVSGEMIYVGELTFFPMAGDHRTPDDAALGRLVFDGMQGSENAAWPAWMLPDLHIRTSPVTGRYRLSSAH